MQLKLEPKSSGAGSGDARPAGRQAGVPLPGALRHEFEAAFGADFSAVRIHQGHQATLVGAAAYSRGNDIHFAPGAYDPHSSTGRELLGHELAHVVQQRSPRAPIVPRGMVDVEREADTVAAAVIKRGAGSVQR